MRNYFFLIIESDHLFYSDSVARKFESQKMIGLVSSVSARGSNGLLMDDCNQRGYTHFALARSRHIFWLSIQDKS